MCIRDSNVHSYISDSNKTSKYSIGYTLLLPGPFAGNGELLLPLDILIWRLTLKISELASEIFPEAKVVEAGAAVTFVSLDQVMYLKYLLLFQVAAFNVPVTVALMGVKRFILPLEK